MATIRQRMVAKRVAEKVRKGEKVSVSKEMRGIYSDAVAKHPEKLTRSKKWKELMAEFLPDKFVLKCTKDNLGAVEVKRMDFSSAFSDQDIKKIITGKGFELTCITKGVMGRKTAHFFKPDYDARSKAADQAYKLKNKFKETIEVDDKTPYSDMSIVELMRRAKLLK